MDPAKLALVFGDFPIPDWVDLDDEKDREAILLEALTSDFDDFDDESDHYGDPDEYDDGDRAHEALLQVVANQILIGDPPDVWSTAQRLLELGIRRDRVLDDLARVLDPHVRRTLHDKAPF